MENKQFEIAAVHAAPEGASYLGQVSFAYRPSEFQAIKISHSNEKDGEWKEYVDAEIEGARMVRIKSAFLSRSKKQNELYVRAQGIDIPWAVCRAVAEAAFVELEKKKK